MPMVFDECNHDGANLFLESELLYTNDAMGV